MREHVLNDTVKNATQIARRLIQLAAVMLIAFAPLSCVQFCQIKREIAHIHFAHDPHFLHHHPQEEQHPPLGEMQHMVHAITDFLPSVSSWLPWLMVLAAVLAPRKQIARQTIVSPPTPPPRRHTL
jgi:hypothetical protein